MREVETIGSDVLGSDDRSTRWVRAYKIWPGRNTFLCYGHFMTGPDEDVGPHTCAWVTMLTPMAHQ